MSRGDSTEPGKNQRSNQDTNNRPLAVENDQVGFNRAYLISIQGILRLVIVVFQFCQWVSAASVPKIINGEYYMIDDFYTTRNACLFFSIVGFCIGLFFYLLFLFNIDQKFDLPWPIATFATDVLWVLPTFSVAIASAVRESMIQPENLLLVNISNKGAFGSASFFGFALTIVYCVRIEFFCFIMNQEDD